MPRPPVPSPSNAAPPSDHVRPWRTAVQHAARSTLHMVPLAVCTGSSVALFLWALDRLTAFRFDTPWLLWLLPLGGAAVAVLYERVGGTAGRGNALLIDEMHEPGGGVPARLAPLVLFGTLVTHLFGGSAGREGTAVQMGGAIASAFERRALSRRRALTAGERRILLQCGVAAGFGAVFGTPVTGAVFALEVLSIRHVPALALVPCLGAALLADVVTRAWGIHHTAYPVITMALDASVTTLVLTVAAAAIAFGLVGAAFVSVSHRVARTMAQHVPLPWLHPVLGGCAVIALTLLVGNRDFLGLGVTSPDPHGVSIMSAFHEGGVRPWAWLLKLVFTAVTVGSGFKGGEVTPLFFIGATLGAALAVPLGAPVTLFAALGFIAVFAGATKTPLACTIMGIELFGTGAAPVMALACAIAYFCSGRASLYTAHRR